MLQLSLNLVSDRKKIIQYNPSGTCSYAGRYKRVKERKGSLCDEECAKILTFLTNKFPIEKVGLEEFLYPAIAMALEENFEISVKYFISIYGRKEISKFASFLFAENLYPNLQSLVLDVLTSPSIFDFPAKLEE